MTIIKSEFSLALNQIATERNISVDEIIESIESAVIAAYKKEYPDKSKDEEISAKVNRETGEIKIFKKGKDITPSGFGRISTQTAKQVIIQKIREAEKKTIISYYQSQLGNIIKGRIVRYDNNNVYLDIGKTEAILPKEDQIKNEKYNLNTNLILYLKTIKKDKFGNTKIFVSRADPQLVIELFKKEVPEISNKSVEIKKIAREPGERTKIAVFSSFSGIDPVGSCVGQKGIRVQTITDQLGGNEKIDIIQWSEDKKQFLISSLSPAKIDKVEIDEKTKKAKVFVQEKEASLAIGKNGVNVNLASKLTDLDIDIIQLKDEEKKQENKDSSSKDNVKINNQQSTVK